MRGIIKRKTDKGFGFIKPEDGGKDIFFHANDCEARNFTGLNEGDTVSFELEQSPKGPKAVHVECIGSQDATATEDGGEFQQ